MKNVERFLIRPLIVSGITAIVLAVTVLTNSAGGFFATWLGVFIGINISNLAISIVQKYIGRKKKD